MSNNSDVDDACKFFATFIVGIFAFAFALHAIFTIDWNKPMDINPLDWDNLYINYNNVA